MQILKPDRATSGTECSCSPYSKGSRPAGQHWQQPKCRGRRQAPIARSAGKAVGSAAIFDLSEPVVAPESELLSRDLFEAKFSGSEASKVSNLQTLERLKGDLNSALEDLEEDVGRQFSVRASTPSPSTVAARAPCSYPVSGVVHSRCFSSNLLSINSRLTRKRSVLRPSAHSSRPGFSYPLRCPALVWEVMMVTLHSMLA